MASFHIPAIRDEANYCVRHDFLPDDRVLTYIHRLRSFTAFNLKMFLPQIADWKRQGCVVKQSNIRKVRIGGRDMVMFIVQPSDLSNTPMSPLALAFDLLVSGYAYIADQGIVDIVLRALEPKN